MKTMLITGGSGLLGSNLARMFRDRFQVFYTYNTNYFKLKKCTPIRMNFLRDYEIVDKILYIKPDIVINCAAITSITECEKNRDAAFHVNVYGTKILADTCEKIGCKLIQISADAIFDGKKGMYTEDDKPNPVNYYGFTKMQAERMARRCENSAIIRTNMYGFGTSGNSFIEILISKLKNRERIYLPDDLFTTPIPASIVGHAIHEIIRKDAIDVYNIAGSERISRFGFARKAASIFGFDENLILPIKICHISLSVELPLDTSLDTKKAASELNVRGLDVSSGLMNMRNAMRNEMRADYYAHYS